MADGVHAGEHLCHHSLPDHGVPALLAYQAFHRSVSEPCTGERGHCRWSIPDRRSNSSFQPGNPGCRRGYEADAQAGGYTLGQRRHMNTPLRRKGCERERRIALKKRIGCVFYQDQVVPSRKRHQALAAFDILDPTQRIVHGRHCVDSAHRALFTQSLQCVQVWARARCRQRHEIQPALFCQRLESRISQCINGDHISRL